LHDCRIAADCIAADAPLRDKRPRLSLSLLPPPKSSLISPTHRSSRSAAMRMRERSKSLTAGCRCSETSPLAVSQPFCFTHICHDRRDITTHHGHTSKLRRNLTHCSHDTSGVSSHTPNRYRFHPDKNKDPSAKDKFTKVATAYEILSDPEKRRIFDTQGSEGLKRHEQRCHFCSPNGSHA
jgi:hypothetical protein